MNQSQAPAPSKDSITEWLVQWIAKELGLPPGEIETDKSLLNYSLSSVTAMMLVGDLEEWLGLTLPPTLVWDYPFDRRHCRLSGGAARHHRGAGAPVATDGGALPATNSAPAGNGAEPMPSLDDMSDQEVTALLNQLIADERAGAAL